MIYGLIGNRDVLRHPWAICRNYGLRFYLHCLQALCDRKRHTFLELCAKASWRL